MRQITIVTSRPDCVAEVSGVLAENRVDIRDFDAQHLGSNTVIKLFAEPYDLCLALLSNAGFSAVSDETLLLRVTDRPGMLAEISRQIAELGVDIRALKLLQISRGENVVAVSTDDNDKLRDAFAAQLID